MNLDVSTLQTVSLIVVTIVTVTFVSEVARRGRTPVDLLWTLAFAGAISSALCYQAAASSPTLWWFNALGNASSVVTTFAMWNGTRAADGRRPLLGATAAAAGVAALATLLPGPDGGPWAGGWAVLLGTAAGALLGGASTFRGRLRRHRNGVALGGTLLAVGLYYSVRLVVYLTAGPQSPAFDVVGTATTTIVALGLVTVAGFCMTGIRADDVHARQASTRAFDAVTGLRNPVTFLPRATGILQEAERAGEPVAVVAIALEGREDLTVAFHAEAAGAALAAVVDAARLLAPPASVAGRAGPDQDAFEILLRGFTGAEAHVWGEALRRRVMSEPLEVDGARVRLRVSVGVAGDVETGYHLAALRARAAERLERALAEGGNTVRSWY